jgi:hypothetical protein
MIVVIRTMSILATAALGAMLAIGPTTTSMAQVENARSGTGDASQIYVRDGGGGGGHGFGDHGFGDRGFSGDFGRGHFAGDRGFHRRRDFRRDLWIGDGYCYPGYYYSYDPYFCG